MTDLDRLLRDPRSHRAVPQQEMIHKVSSAALKAWTSENVNPATPQARRSFVSRPGVVGAGLFAIGAGVTLFSPVIPGLPRLDILLKYELYDLVDATAAGMMNSPLQTGFLLAALAATIGFGLSTQARQALRHLL